MYVSARQTDRQGGGVKMGCDVEYKLASLHESYINFSLRNIHYLFIVNERKGREQNKKKKRK